ncbi:hypothetical protein NL676_036730 [Syzygium grande]|nr:hypothetical protein NL676_036730 [Syzygium grande]
MQEMRLGRWLAVCGAHRLDSMAWLVQTRKRWWLWDLRRIDLVVSRAKARGGAADFVGTGKFAETARGSCWNLTENVGLAVHLDQQLCGNDTPKSLELLECCDGGGRDFRQRSPRNGALRLWPSLTCRRR